MKSTRIQFIALLACGQRRETSRPGGQLRSHAIWPRVVAGTMLIMGVTAGTTSVAGAVESTSSLRGVVAVTAAGAELGYDINGSAVMVINSEGTNVKVAFAGLDAAKVYGSHLHNGACAEGGGGHYQNVEGGETTPPNELWVVTSGTVVEPKSNGFVDAAGSATWQARTSGIQTLGRSVVLHEPGGARIACADLRQLELTGPFAGMSGVNGAIARIYMGVFRRQPDVSGHTYWVNVAKGGRTVTDIAGYFVASVEFRQTYGHLGDPDFVDMLYENVMARQGDPGGVKYWNEVLAAGAPRSAVILAFSESPEFKILTKTS